MIVKAIFYLFILSVYGQSYAMTEEDCYESSEIEGIAKSLSYPNCVTEKNIQDFQFGETKNTCETCKKKYELLIGKPVTKSKKSIQDDFFDVSVQEYKKSILNNIMNAVKMSLMHNSGATFTKSIKSCKMKSVQEIAESCKSPRAKELLKDPKHFKEMSEEIANDIAKMVSTDENFNPDPTLLKRGSAACFIPERDVISFATSTSEEMLNEKLIEALKKIDTKKYKSVREMFESDEIYDQFGDLSELKQSLDNHPFISQYFQSSDKLSSFLSSIPTPANTLNLQKRIYNSANSAQYDEAMATSCEESFKNFEKSVCSNDFEAGNLSLNPSENYSKLGLSKLEASPTELANTDKLVAANLRLLQYCEEKKNGSLSLTDSNSRISSLLNDKQKSQNLDTFSSQKHITEIGSVTDALCKMDECKNPTPVCSIFNKYKDPKRDKSLEAKLARTSNPEVNALLRSMIGDASKVSAATKTVLVSNGILPKDDGTIVAQPTIPERQPDYFAKVPQPAAKPTAFAPSSTERKTASSQNAARQYDGPDYTQTSFQNLKTPSTVDFKDLVDDSTQDLKDIQNEIRRRLTDLGPSKVNKAQAQKIVKESFAASGKTPTPVQETNYTNRILNSVAQEASAAAEPQPVAVAGIGADTSATGSTTKAWREAQKNEALAGMAGAQAVSAREILDAKAAASAAAAAADPAAKPLTNVALSIAEDPRVSLSDVLNDKVNRNDSETQLLKVLVRNKQPFMLKVKDLNFKVIFDNSQPKILLESGDKKEAERLRPQLELFFNKLRSNSIYVIR